MPASSEQVVSANTAISVMNNMTAPAENHTERGGAVKRKADVSLDPSELGLASKRRIVGETIQVSQTKLNRPTKPQVAKAKPRQSEGLFDIPDTERTTRRVRLNGKTIDASPVNNQGLRRSTRGKDNTSSKTAPTIVRAKEGTQSAGDIPKLMAKRRRTRHDKTGSDVKTRLQDSPSQGTRAKSGLKPSSHASDRNVRHDNDAGTSEGVHDHVTRTRKGRRGRPPKQAITPAPERENGERSDTTNLQTRPGERGARSQQVEQEEENSSQASEATGDEVAVDSNDAELWSNATEVLNAKEKWQDFKFKRDAWEEKRKDVRRLSHYPQAVNQFVKHIKSILRVCNAVRGAASPSADEVTDADNIVNADINKMERTLPELEADQQDEQMKMAYGLYLKCIPRLAELLLYAPTARYAQKTVPKLTIQETIRLLHLFVTICTIAVRWEPKPEIPLNRLTRSMCIPARRLLESYRREIDGIESAKLRATIDSKLKQAHKDAKARNEEEDRKWQQELQQYWAQVDVDLRAQEEKYPIVLATGNKQLRRVAQLASPGPIRGPNTETPHRAVDTDLDGGSPELGDDEIDTRDEPSVIRIQEIESPFRIGVGRQRISRVPAWTLQEETALIDGLQEFRGPTRYYDIFNKYSERELARQDFDTIEEKAKAIKTILIHELRDTEEYDQYDWLWSVRD